MDNLPENQNLPKGIISVQNKKIPAGLVLFVLISVALGITGYYFAEKEKNQNLSTTPPLSQKPSNIKPVLENTWPAMLPQDLFSEPKAKILQFFTINEGLVGQVTLQYASAKTIEENFNLYKKYLNNNKWTIINTVSQNKFKSISAKKFTNFLNININNSRQEEKSVVDITIITHGFTTLK